MLIDIRAELQRDGWRENFTTATPSVQNTPLMPPLSSDMTSSSDMPAPASTDIQNHSTPAQQKEQIDILNGDKITSSDIRDPVSGEVKMPKPTSRDRTMATPAPRRDGDVINIPDAVYYDSERDKNTPKGKIMTEATFKEWLARKLNDGQKTCIRMPLRFSETPAFYIYLDKKESLSNYRVKGRYYIVDCLFDRAYLKIGNKRVAIVRDEKLTDTNIRESRATTGRRRSK